MIPTKKNNTENKAMLEKTTLNKEYNLFNLIQNISGFNQRSPWFWEYYDAFKKSILEIEK